MSNLTTYENEIYYGYLSIEDKAYQEKVRFVETHGQVIEKLDTGARVEILYNYALALFELDKNHQVIELCKNLLETVIDENIYTIDSVNIYEELLVLKAISHYKLREIDKSEYIFSELIRMNANKETYHNWLFKVRAYNKRNEQQAVRAISILLCLLSGLVIAFELFLIRPFHEQFVSEFELGRNLLVLSAIVLLLTYALVKKYRNKQALQHIK